MPKPTIILVLQRLLIVAALVVAAVIAYILIFNKYFDDGRLASAVLALWLVSAYFVLPHFHRLMSRLYLPDYFIGRVRTADGLLGDPINLSILGNQQQLMRAMEKAGWQRADDLSLKTSLAMMRSTLLRKSYPHAPVSSLFLFGRKQDLAYQREIDRNPSQRHHVRFWKTPRGWKLPGGFKADWLAAGTYDKSVGLSFFTLQVTHKIAEDTDEERDFIIKSLQKSGAVKTLQLIKDYTAGYHHRGGGGDAIKTDGAMPFIKLN